MKGRRTEKRFRALFIALLFVLIGEPIFLDLNSEDGWFSGFFSLIILAVMLAFLKERAHRLVVLVIGIPTLILGHGWFWIPASFQTVAFAGSRVGAAFLLLATSYMVVRSVVTREKITTDHIFGAVCGYLLLGLAWAVAYSLAGYCKPDCFRVENPSELTNPYDLTIYVYFSFATLTTLGYGDIIPMTKFIRTLTWMEAMVGQFYLAVIVAWLVSSLSDRTSEELERKLNG